MRVQGELAEILVTVKASPQPSIKYRDTVCVAGIRIDGGRRDWIRLYPIPFRWLNTSHQFAKYDIIRVEVRRRDQDTRPESYVPDTESIETVEHLAGWKARHPIMKDVPRTTTCQLRRAALARHDSPSLGMVEVRDVGPLEFAKHPGWSEAEKDKIAASLRMPVFDLFGESVNVPPMLEAPPFKVRYRYFCMETECLGHGGQILDWELTALLRRTKGLAESEIKKAVTEKFLTQMIGAKKHTSFFMGNFEDVKKRHNFSVLGVYYPDLTLASKATLFDF